MRIENNYFDDVARPIRGDTNLSNVAGHVSHVDTHVFVNSGANSITASPATWTPPCPTLVQ